MAADAAKPSLARGVILPSLLGVIGFGVLGLFLSKLLGDSITLAFGLGLGCTSFVAGRILGHLDRPRGRGVFLRHVLAGVALGFVGWAVLRSIFLSGPGWPWTPWWVLAGGFGVGLYRSHRALLQQARGAEDARRVWGVFHPRDLEALAVLMLGYAIVGVTGFLVFRAFSGLIPGAGKMLTIATAVYALQGARLLLRFASEERASSGGWVGWLKANALQNAIVVLLLVAYAVFRDELATSVPFFPLVEFGLGIAVFGFVLARLRARMRREGAALGSASDAKDHVRVVTELREVDYDAIARPVTRFIEAGTGQAEYGEAVAAALPENDPRREPLLAPLRAHREPPRPPPLALPWAFAAGGAMALGLAVAAFTLGTRLLHADMPFPIILALVFVALGVYAQQDAARAHHRPWLGLAIASGGAGILFLDFLLFASTVGSIFGVPTLVWGIAGAIAAALLGVPAYAGWRLQQRLSRGLVVDARRVAPALEMQNEIQRTRKRAATMTFVALAILLPVPWLAGWLAGRNLIPEGFPTFLDDVLAVTIWVAAAFGIAAVVRFYGLTRGRPALLARERAKRARRLAVHRTLMQSLERM